MAQQQAIIKGDIVRLKTGSSDIRVTDTRMKEVFTYKDGWKEVSHIRGRYVNSGMDVDWRSTCDFVKVSNSSQERTPVETLTPPKIYTADTCPDGDYFRVSDNEVTMFNIGRYRKIGGEWYFSTGDLFTSLHPKSDLRSVPNRVMLIPAPRQPQPWDNYILLFRSQERSNQALCSPISDEDQIKRAEAYIAWVKARKPTE